MLVLVHIEKNNGLAERQGPSSSYVESTSGFPLDSLPFHGLPFRGLP